MKITDLMIGDFFSFNGNKYKIEDIKKCGAIHVEYYPEGGRVEFNSDFILEDLKPIPLTEEILEKNGWKWGYANAKFFPGTWIGNLLLRKDKEGFHILAVSDYDDEDTNDTPFVIRYVHELQNTMRLFGFEKEIEL